MRSRKDLPPCHQTRVLHPEQSEGWAPSIPDPDSKRDTVCEFPTSLCKLPQTPFLGRIMPGDRTLPNSL
jgi:hypothetical protein